MSIDAEAIVDRRRLRRKLSFWRVLAISASSRPWLRSADGAGTGRR